MMTLKERIERVAAMIPRERVEEDSPTDTPSLTILERREQALDDLFSRRVPLSYAKCLPVDVPQITDDVFRGKGVFLNGNPGIGKTYAATAIARMFIGRRWRLDPDPAHGNISYPSTALIWTTAPRFMTRIRSTNSQKARESSLDIMEEYDRAFVVVLDDYGAEKPSDYAAETLYDMLTGRLNDHKFTIITTNLTVKEIAEWRPAVASRLAELNKVRLPDRDWRLIKKVQCA